MKHNDFVVNYLLSIPDDDLISINNEMCDLYGYDDNYICYMCDLNNIAEGLTGRQLAEMMSYDFDANDRYFKISNRHLISFNNPIEQIDFKELRDFILDNVNTVENPEMLKAAMMENARNRDRLTDAAETF